MAKFVLAVSLMSVPFSSGAGVCDEMVLTQAVLKAHNGVVPEQPRPDWDRKAIAARIRGEMEAVLMKGKAEEFFGKKASSLNAVGGEQGGMTVGLASAGQSLKVDSSYGLIMQRSDAFVEEGSSVRLEFGHGCNSTDALGANDCLIPANDRTRLRLTYNLREPAREGTTLEMNFSTRLYGFAAVIGQQLRGWKTDRFVQDLENVNVTCPLCGGTCEVDVFGKHVSQVMPDCPLPAGVDYTVVDTDLKMPSTQGLKMLRSKYVGSFVVKRPDGSVIASTSGKVRLGERDMAPCPFILQQLNKCKN